MSALLRLRHAPVPHSPRPRRLGLIALATVLLTPRASHELMNDYHRFTGGDQAWSRFYGGMYGSSLIAL